MKRISLLLTSDRSIYINSISKCINYSSEVTRNYTSYIITTVKFHDRTIQTQTAWTESDYDVEIPDNNLTNRLERIERAWNAMRFKYSSRNSHEKRTEIKGELPIVPSNSSIEFLIIDRISILYRKLIILNRVLRKVIFIIFRSNRQSIRLNSYNQF